MARPTPAAIAFLPVAGLLLLTGCSPEPAKATAVPTHTLAYARYAYAGNLVPAEETKLSITPANLGIRPGSHVAAGDELGGNEASVAKVQELDRSTAGYRSRIKVAEGALAALAKGRAVTFERDATLPSAAVRAIEHDIQAELLAERRAEAEHKAELAKIGTDVPGAAQERKTLQQNRKLEKEAAVARLQALFENLRSESQAAVAEADQQRATLSGTAPFAGVVSVREGEVWLSSDDPTFQYVATEEQVDSLSAEGQLELSVREQRVGTLRLATVTFNQDATTNPQAPRYTMTFDVVAPEDFAPRPHSTASLGYTGTRLAIPDAYLGRDPDGTFVMVDGERRNVQVAKDGQGQFVLAEGQLRAGDRIQRVGGEG